MPSKKLGRPTLSAALKRTERVYVLCRARDKGAALRIALRAARDAYERKADATPTR
jgi:Flp pilus assembly protein CpaB